MLEFFANRLAGDERRIARRPVCLARVGLFPPGRPDGLTNTIFFGEAYGTCSATGNLGYSGYVPAGAAATTWFSYEALVAGFCMAYRKHSGTDQQVFVPGVDMSRYPPCSSGGGFAGPPVSGD